MSDRLMGKVAVVTGGMSGIGEAIVQRFRAEGATVVTVDLADGADVTANVTVQAEITAAMDGITQEHGRIDTLVTSAGIGHVGTLMSTAEVDFDRVYAVNVKGVFLSMRAAIPHMAPGSSILNIASIASTVGIPDRFAYSMSKGAVLTMTYSVATDLLPLGIRCNCIAPARVHTPFVDRFLAENYPGSEDAMFATLAATQPIGRMAAPAEIAGLALYLCSDEAGFVTGANLPIDGGFTGIRP